MRLWRAACAAVALLALACSPGSGGSAPSAARAADPPAPSAPVVAVATAPPAAPAASSAAPVAAAPPAPATVRVGAVAGVSNAGMFYASERGYFAQEGLEVEYLPFDSAARMITALAADQLDVGAGSASAGLLNAIARGVGLRITGPLARHEPGNTAVYVMVRKELVDSGAVRDWPDLKGRTIAIAAKASTNEYAADLLAERGGFTLADLNVVELNFSDMLSAFANGAIDIAIVNEPASTAGVDRGVAVKWREITDLQQRFQFTVVLYSPELATTRADAGRRWMTAYLRGVRDYDQEILRAKDRPGGIALISRYTSIPDPALFERVGWTLIDPNGEVDRASLEAQVRWLVDQGAAPAIQLDQVIDPRFAAYAVERLGRYQP